MRRILGIDPGSRVTGFGIIESNGDRSLHIAGGCIRVEGDFPKRLGEIYRGLSAVVSEHQPDESGDRAGVYGENPSIGTGSWGRGREGRPV